MVNHHPARILRLVPGIFLGHDVRRWDERFVGVRELRSTRSAPERRAAPPTSTRSPSS